MEAHKDLEKCLINYALSKSHIKQKCSKRKSDGMDLTEENRRNICQREKNLRK